MKFHHLKSSERKQAENLLSTDIGFDTKKRLNRSDVVPNISLKSIERGITLEELQKLNVPVYKYKTQITIHGKFPKTENDMTTQGLRFVVQNKNGSFGVKYPAIDITKKTMLSKILMLSRCKWDCYTNSQGTTLVYSLGISQNDIDKLFLEMKNFPEQSVVGSLGVYKNEMFGISWLAVDVRALPSQYFWGLVSYLTGREFASKWDYKSLLKSK